MGKYEELTKDILALFADPLWVAEGVKTYPGDFVGTAGNTYIRVHILPSGAGINRHSVSGQVLIDIFTPAGNGPLAAVQIADKLDEYLVDRSKVLSCGTLQFLQSSAVSHRGKDSANPALSRAVYAIPFNLFGE